MAAPLAADANDAAPVAAKARPKVALIGLGNMGSAIAERLLDAGYPLSVFNRTRSREGALVDRGTTRLESASAALAEADVCLTSLADDAAIESVVLGDHGVF